MNTRQRIAVALSAAVLVTPTLATPAGAAPVMYGATGIDSRDTSPPPPSNLYTINPATGAGTVIGPIGYPVTGLALSPADGVLYGATADVDEAGTQRKLLSINPTTGAGTVVGSLGINEIEDIAFDAAGGLWGWNVATNTLARIARPSATTATVTNLGPSGTGISSGGGLAFNLNGVLYGLLDGDDGHLWTVDGGSGVATRARGLSGSPNQSGALLGAATFGCDGTTLYSVVNDFGTPPTYLVNVNTVNGDITTIGQTVPALDALAVGGCATKSGAPPASPAAVIPPASPAARKDLTAPRVSLLSKSRQSLKTLRGGGLRFTLRVDEAAKLDVRLLGRLTKNKARGKARQLARVTVNSASAGQLTVTLRPTAALRTALRREKRLPGVLQVKATDASGNVTTRTKLLTFR